MSLPVEYFDEFYGNREDPWGFRDRWFEQRKRALILAALPKAGYRNGFEPGCGNGELTALLAQRCEHLQSADVSSVAVRAARERTAALPGVDVSQGGIPDDWPAGRFDLIVLVEVAYYLSSDDLGRLDGLLRDSLLPGGTLLACHWRHPVADYPLAADEVHQALSMGRHRIGGWRDADFLLDVFSDDPTGVAAQEGLA